MSLHPVHVPTRDEVIRAYTKPTPRALSLACLVLAAIGTLRFGPNEFTKQITVFMTDDVRTEVKEEVRKALRRYFKRFDRRPVILPFVLEM